ncbi:MAG: hypothetical protein QXP53_02800 [Candidatus Pacearchaeota archaeon]
MKKIILFSLVLVILIASTQSASATQNTKVEVGLYVLNLGKFDVGTGTFTADFYLDLKCSESCEPGNFEFVNGRATSIDKIIDTPNEEFYRIQANLNSPIDLKKFPFDEQKIQIIIEDKKNTIKELEYVPLFEESGLDDSITFPGWKIGGWEINVSEHEYVVYNETYSQYSFIINISRIKSNSFLKTFLPVLVIVLIVLVSFLMDPDKITNRLTIATSSLVASVMFHISISNQIPPVGYLTIADKFMILTYAFLLFVVIFNVILLELHERKKIDMMEKLHRNTEYSIFFIIAFVYFLFFIFI